MYPKVHKFLCATVRLVLLQIGLTSVIALRQCKEKYKSRDFCSDSAEYFNPNFSTCRRSSDSDVGPRCWFVAFLVKSGVRPWTSGSWTTYGCLSTPSPPSRVWWGLEAERLHFSLSALGFTSHLGWWTGAVPRRGGEYPVYIASADGRDLSLRLSSFSLCGSLCRNALLEIRACVCGFRNFSFSFTGNFFFFLNRVGFTDDLVSEDAWSLWASGFKGLLFSLSLVRSFF